MNIYKKSYFIIICNYIHIAEYFIMSGQIPPYQQQYGGQQPPYGGQQPPYGQQQQQFNQTQNDSQVLFS